MGYRPQSRDTGREVEDRLFAAYRAMTPTQKLQRVAELNLAAEALCLAGLRARFPEASAAELRDRVIEIRLGPALWAAYRAHRAAIASP